MLKANFIEANQCNRDVVIREDYRFGLGSMTNIKRPAIETLHCAIRRARPAVEWNTRAERG